MMAKMDSIDSFISFMNLLYFDTMVLCSEAYINN